ncbi:S-layer family protein [Ureibacillus xyleni]|uniref:S-layer family protein n=1 Tax=Ureibacillus xyleni TaxID=614648 RepID=A0A285REK2_9BACL|nr:S-layer homology domain-containing protein [Ureibacillus xyleni]SOB90807.1 S-layer family protein [Ureibacillus xyleni]
MTKTNANKFFKAGVAAAVVVSSGVVAAPIVSQAEETQNSISFKDLSTKNPYYTDIMNLAERGIIKGFPDKTFGTYKDITRGQAAKILAQVLHLDTENVTDPGFVDVKKDSEYYGAIAALQNAGIINGYTNDNTFRAGEFVTRNHMAKMIAIGFGFETNSTAPFTDMHDSYKEYISALFENGVTTGRTSTTFDGLSFVTRGQMAAFAVRAENVTKEITFTINDIEASKIVTSEGQFRSSLPIFNAANSAALEGAVVNAVITNGEVKAINALTLNNSGSEENPVVLDGGNTIIDGVLTVNADFTNLKNITVNEDVILTSTVANNFDANGLDIKGELVIVEEVQAQLASLTMFANLTSNGPKVNLTNSAVKAVNAKRDNVIISSNIKLPEVKVAANVTSIEVNANVATVTVNASEALQIKGSASIDKVNVQQATQLALEVTGLVKQLDLANAEAKVSLGTNISVEKIVVPTGSNISTLINDYETVKEKIVEVVDNSGAVVEPPVNNGGNQGGEGTPGENGNPGSGGTPGDEGNNGTPGNGGTPGDGGNNGTPGNDVTPTDIEKINATIASVTGNKVEELKFANVNENLVKDLAALLTEENVDLTPIGSLIADADGDDADETVSEAEFVAFFTSLNHDQVIAQYGAVLTADQKAVLAKLKEIYPSPVVKTDVEKINEVIASVTGNKVEELKFANVNENLVKDLAALLTKDNVNLTPIGSLIADADGDDAGETVSEAEFVAFFTSLNHDQVIAQYDAVLTADQKAVLAKLKEIYPSPVVKTDVEKINEVIASVTGNKVEELKFANVNENLVKDLAALLTKENVDLTPIGSLIADADGDDADETVSEVEFVAFFTNLNHDQVIAQYGAVLTADQKAVLAKLKEIYPSPVVVKTDLEKINEVIADVTGDKVDELTFTNVDQNLVEDLANLLTKENVDLTPIGSLIADADGDDADETVSEVEFVAFFTSLNYDQVVAQYGAVLTDDQKDVLAKLKEIYPTPAQPVASTILNMDDTFTVENGVVKFI